MTRINSRIVLPLVTLFLGALWLVYGLIEYGWWGDNGPQSGFFPAIIGALMIGVSGIAINQGRKGDPPRYLKSSFHPLLGVVGVVLGSYVVGFFPALFLFIFGWIKFYEKYGWWKSLITSVITVALFFGVFSVWLRVPFPDGWIVDTIRG